MIEACDALDIIRTKNMMEQVLLLSSSNYRLRHSEDRVPHFEVSAGTAALMRKAG